MRTGDVIHVQEACHVSNEGFLVFTSFSIREGDAVQTFNDSGSLYLCQCFDVSCQGVRISCFFGDKFAALQNLVSAIRAHIETGDQNLRDHVAFEIGVHTVDQCRLDEQGRSGLIRIEVADRWFRS